MSSSSAVTVPKISDEDRINRLVREVAAKCQIGPISLSNGFLIDPRARLLLIEYASEMTAVVLEEAAILSMHRSKKSKCVDQCDVNLILLKKFGICVPIIDKKTNNTTATAAATGSPASATATATDKADNTIVNAVASNSTTTHKNVVLHKQSLRTIGKAIAKSSDTLGHSLSLKVNADIVANEPAGSASVGVKRKTPATNE